MNTWKTVVSPLHLLAANPLPSAVAGAEEKRSIYNYSIVLTVPSAYNILTEVTSPFFSNLEHDELFIKSKDSFNT